YDALAVPAVPVHVSDDDAPGVLVRATDGSTDVIESTGQDGAPWVDAYDVVLTRAPEAGQTVTVRVAPQATRTSRGGTSFSAVQVEVSAGAASSSDPSHPLLLVFDASNWNVPQRVTVRAVDDVTVDGGDTREFPSRFVVGDIAGPLT